MNKRKNKQDIAFLDHLEILRRKFIWIFLIFLAFSVTAFFYMEPIIHFLKAPLKGLNVQLVYLKPQEKFMAYFKLAFFSGIFGVLPFALFQISHFILPALKSFEKKAFLAIVALAFLFFLGGAALSYFYLIPFVLEFFTEFGGGEILPLWSIGEYLHLLILMIFLIGIVFQSPWIMLFLMRIGIVKPETLARSRKIVLVGIFVVAAIITPPDIYSQILIGTILYLFFELTLFAGKRFGS
jgi:sec-independent protein translocase protein TatC